MCSEYIVEIERPSYLSVLAAKRGNGQIKVITGIRRCGKSYLLTKLFPRMLAAGGVPDDRIVIVDLEDFANRRLRDPEMLYEHVRGRVEECNGASYVIIDEVQRVDGFEDVVMGIARLPGADVYVTGSNSKGLSSDVITEFRGRGDQVRVRPLSFAEYLPAHGGTERRAWQDYYTFGGMPLVLSQAGDAERVAYLQGLFDTVYLRDVCERYDVRHEDALDALVNVLASADGSLTSLVALQNTFRSERGAAITDKTIKTYIDYLKDAFLLEEAEQYDVKGRRYISSPKKYYFEDVGLRNARLGMRQLDEGHVMENVVYNELRRRGWSVDVGVVPVTETGTDGARHQRRLEIDFVARRGSDQVYLQSAFALPTPEKVEQEYRSLRKVRDSFRKFVVVGDDVRARRGDDGIITIGIVDFLLDDKSLEL